MEETYITLPSNGGGVEFHAVNKNNSFKVKLPKQLRLSGNSWQVGLASISLSLHNEFRQAIFKKFPSGTVLAKVNGYTTKLDPGGRRTIASKEAHGTVTVEQVLEDESITDGVSFMKSLVRLLEQHLALWFLVDNEKTGRMKTEWKNPDTDEEYFQTFRWTTPTSLLIDGSRCDRKSDAIWTEFNEEFFIMLGAMTSRYDFPGPQLRVSHYKSPPKNEEFIHTFSSSLGETIKLRQQQNWEFPNLNWGWFENNFFSPTRTLHVYCNAGKSTIVGERVTDLLREIALSSTTTGDRIYFEPAHIHYIPIRQEIFDYLEVEIAELNGALANLGDGPTNVTLHFKRNL